MQHQRYPARAHNQRVPRPSQMLDALSKSHLWRMEGRPPFLFSGVGVPFFPVVLLHRLGMDGGQPPIEGITPLR